MTSHPASTSEAGALLASKFSVPLTELELPIVGKEEDAVDNLANIIMVAKTSDPALDSMLRAVADGIVPTVEILVDGVLTRVPVLGPNHYAAEIWAGRGEAQSEILDFALPASEMPRRNADAAPARGRFAVFVSDAAPVASDAAVQRAARTARTDVASVGRLPAEVSATLSSAPLSGRYGNRTEPCPSCGATEANASCETCGATPCGEWLGWIVPTPAIRWASPT